MNAKLLSIAAAAAITLSTAGAANAAGALAPALPKAGISVDVQPVYYGGYYKYKMCKVLRYKGFVLGSWYHKKLYFKYCTYGYGPVGYKYKLCKMLKYKGFVLGSWYHKKLYFKHCKFGWY